jgi:hypothetical protein
VLYGSVMMNTIAKNLAAVLVFAVALSTGACATDEATAPTTDAIWVDATEIVSVDGHRSTELVGLGMSEDPVVVESSACECTTDDCVTTYIRDNLGCDLCIDISCADGSWRGGCVRCE